MRPISTKRLIAGVVGALCLVALAPSVASAATLTSSGGAVTYTAAPGETNALVITVSGTNFSFAPGTGVTTTPSAPCVGGGVPGVAATCPIAGVTSISVDLGDGNDTLTASSSALPASVPINAQGGDGNDTLTTGNAVNNLQGGTGNDSFSPGGGNDTVQGGDGNDTMSPLTLAPDGNDDYQGGQGTDTVGYLLRSAGVNVSLDDVANDGGPGETDNIHSDVESVLGSAQADTVTGSAANNTFTLLNGNDVASGGDGNDSFTSIAANDGNDSFTGGAGNDSFVGIAANDGNDTFSGGEGNDTLATTNASPDGGDTFDGGSGPFDPNTHADQGTDTVAYLARTAPVTVNLTPTDDANATDGATGEGDSIKSTVENVLTAGAADHVTGNAANNLLAVSGGDDVVDGGKGNDIVDANTGNDTVTGDAGTDILLDGTGADVLRGGAGDDILLNTAPTADGRDVYGGGAGSDIVGYSARTASLYINLADTTPDQGEAGEKDRIIAAESILSGSGNDVLLGNGRTNLISDGGGNDYDEGELGDDVMVGGAGDDTIHGDNPRNLVQGGSDIIIGGPGHDDCDGGPGVDIFLCDDEDTVEVTDGDEDVVDQQAINLLLKLAPQIQGLENQLGPLTDTLGPVVGPIIAQAPPLPLPVPVPLPDFPSGNEGDPGSGPVDGGLLP